jgi:CDP-paratose 2-epimerase
MTFADRTILITGGAGFIGTNLASRALSAGARVIILDDLSRNGVTANLERLAVLHTGAALRVEIGDVRDPTAVRRALMGVDHVFHLAGQVAVTTSVTDPQHDFSVNLGGTVTLLEELRRLDATPTLLFTSTNKVYGDMADIVIERSGDRYRPRSSTVRRFGIGEERPLSFCSPYGCSKGGADQYVLDYAKTYGLSTVVFRMSCIYGPHQCGNEDQGWVAHFLLRAMAGLPITIFGDGRQVRDALYVDDLIDAMQLTLEHQDAVRGQAFNIGGSAAQTVSLLELLELVASLEGRTPEVAFDEWRVGDQRCYVSDIRKFGAATGWAPRMGVVEGVRRLHRWATEHDIAATMVGAV